MEKRVSRGLLSSFIFLIFLSGCSSMDWAFHSCHPSASFSLTPASSSSSSSTSSTYSPIFSLKDFQITQTVIQCRVSF